VATVIPPFPPNVLEALGNSIGNAYSHRQLSDLFTRAHIEDEANGARWLRVRDNLAAQQGRDRAANAVARFVVEALAPANFLEAPDSFEPLRVAANRALSFVGLAVDERGEISRIAEARTLTEADARADRLRGELSRRRVHPDVLRFCDAELLVENYFHATFEAAKSVADKIRRQTGLSGDGVSLVNEALGRGNPLGPYLLFNNLSSTTEQNEHDGIADMMRGLFRVFRNVPAHLPRVEGNIGEQEAMDLFTLASYLHRRLDAAQQTHRCGSHQRQGSRTTLA
jgi:uncharacterized protein (TIGR02391 family)